MTELLTIDISGADARERGRQYGEAAREQIARSAAFYAESVARKTGLGWPDVLARAPRWIPVIEDYAPGLLDEVRGIADGSNRSFEEILALNSRGELTRGNPFEDDEGCTSFAILPEANAVGHVWAGQNWDLWAAAAETVVVLRISQPGKPTIVCHLEAGQLGRHGANSAGLALNANGLGAGFGQGLGVPGTFVRRKVLESWDLHDALQAVFDARQSLSSNLLLTHRDGFAIDVETTPGRHGWMYPTDGLLVHGNHFQAFVPPQIDDHYKPFSVDSLYRVPRVEAGLRQARLAGTTEEAVNAIVQTTMSDHFGHPNAVCQHVDPRRHELDRYATIVSSLVDLTTGTYRLTPGLPCANSYQQAPWNLYDGPGPDDRPDVSAPALSLAGLGG
ncbi:isopenicillin-N N-acyltransferase-like protein [Kribbella sp. VKM Ac-2527]|uniref:Isopenicillin-N N-acyltransferase-like protein n=1 Tax=Kribbella caucasensis TaxID=2512215 RepID=A0A4R6KCY8_9ACTN|nr:C45 family peptidase [Kribbella sp. VKM Ac-2527]TDO45695.1 isopenicillin-N N-acyltransferase-like protein [Kribbella sp. VKM Ac-2527]